MSVNDLRRSPDPDTEIIEINMSAAWVVIWTTVIALAIVAAVVFWHEPAHAQGPSCPDTLSVVTQYRAMLMGQYERDLSAFVAENTRLKARVAELEQAAEKAKTPPPAPKPETK